MKNIKKLGALVLSAAMAASLVMVSPAPVDAAKNKVTITAPTKKSTYTVTRNAKNKTITLKYKASGSAVKSVKVTSSNTKVVSVKKGASKTKATLTVKAGGTATITVKATYKTGKTASSQLKIKVTQKATKVSENVAKAYKVSGAYLIPKGKTKTLTPVFTPASTSNKNVTYKTSNKKVLTVTKKGVVKAVGAAGKTATITMTAKDGSKKSVKVKFKIVNPASKVVLNDGKDIELTVGQKSEALSVKVENKSKKNTCDQVAFTSSNTKIAKVSAKGVVTAVAEGTAKITATAKDGSNKKATITVTVKPEPAKTTVVKVKAGAKATMSLTTKDAKTLLDELEAAAKLCKDELDKLKNKTMTFTVNDKAYVVKYDAGVISYADATGAAVTKETIIAKAADKKASFTVVSEEAADILAVAEAIQNKKLAVNAAASITLENGTAKATISDIKLGGEAEYSTFKDGDTVVQMRLENGTIVVVGEGTLSPVFEMMKSAGIVEY
ncbi:MAG: Ig-like domain-containing protein [Lachnospiraceae bacterium]|nr:Ig-like domain-containing protein [Lachnospiraceae bacterium]